jgi:hypothetical protein
MALNLLNILLSPLCDGLGQRLDQTLFADPGRTAHDQVAVREQRRDQATLLQRR